MATNISLARFVILLCLASLGTLIHALPATTDNHGSHIARRSITLDLKRNPNYCPHGPAAYARALQKWGKKVPDALTTVLGEVGDISAVSVRNDREYLSSVGFGTPLQWLDVDLDTGSSDVWMYSSDTFSSIASGHSTYKMNLSTTAQKVPNATWTIAYGDGSTAWGNIYRDSLSLAGIALHNATLESATSASPDLASDASIDGIFGLAYALPSQTTPRQPTVLSQLLPLLSEQLFTADLRYHAASNYTVITPSSSDDGSDDNGNDEYDEAKPASAFTFGYVDPDRHTSPVSYTPISPANATFWQVDYAGMRVAGQGDWYASNKSTSVIVDTGTSLMLLGRDIAEMYYGAVEGAGRNYSVGGAWTFPCDTGSSGGGGSSGGDRSGSAAEGKVAGVRGGPPGGGGGGGGSHSAGHGSSGPGGDGNGDGDDGYGAEGTATAGLPDFEISFPGGFVARVPGRFINYATLPDDPSTCMGGIQEWDDAFGILGDVFLKAVYAVFDVSGARVGFAEKDLGAE